MVERTDIPLYIQSVTALTANFINYKKAVGIRLSVDYLEKGAFRTQKKP